MFSGLSEGQQDVDEVLDTGQCPPTLGEEIFEKFVFGGKEN